MTPAETTGDGFPDPSRPWITDLLPADIRWSRLMASACSPPGVIDRMSREPGLVAECIALVVAVPGLAVALATLRESVPPVGPGHPWRAVLDRLALPHSPCECPR